MFHWTAIGVQLDTDSCEALAVFGRCDADMAGERTAQSVSISKSAMGGDLFWRFMALLQQLAGSAHAGLLNPSRRRDSNFASKQPRKMARA